MKMNKFRKKAANQTETTTNIRHYFSVDSVSKT